MRPAFLLFAVLFVACSHDHDDGHTHDERAADCVAIGERCHPFDVGSGLAHDCHANSHAAWDAATCTAKKTECFAACTANDSGTDAAPADAATETSVPDTADGG